MKDPIIKHVDDIFGADASSFMPFLSMLSGSKPTNALTANGQELQRQIDQMQNTQKMVVFGAVGVGVLGMLYLLLKR